MAAMGLLLLMVLLIVALAVVALFFGRSKKKLSDATKVAPPIADPHGDSKFDPK